MQKFDVLVVGGGMAGLETAARLKFDSVCILEAGQFNSEEPVSIAQWCRPEALDADWWPCFLNADGSHYNKGFGLRRRLGGRSLCWHGVSLPMESYAFHDSWSKEAIEWVSDEEEVFSIHQSHLQQNCTIPVSATLKGYENAPLLKSHKTNSIRSDGIYSPLDLRCSSTYRVALGHQVVGISKLEQGYEVVARCGSKLIPFRAPIVAFAAAAAMNGAFRQMLRPDLGHSYIRDHIVVGRSLISTSSIATSEHALQFRTMSQGHTRVFVELGSWSGGTKVDMWTMASDKCSVTAKIQKDSIIVDRESIETTYTERCRDLFSIVDDEFDTVVGMLGLRRPKFQEWAERLDSHEATISLEEGTLPVDLAVPYEGFLGASDHEHGTVPFGVIDQYGELIGNRGAFFVGPSCFPSLGGTNPTLPSLAQCRVTADRINHLI